MRKLYRYALFAGVLAFGVAACGDDVQIVDPEPTPPPPLSVTLTPSNQSVTVGETASFAVGVSGGDQSQTPTWTCASSNTSVATVSTTDSGCSATAVSAGNASITVTVTRGGQSSNAGAQLSVSSVADSPATVSIDRVTQGGTTNPVDIDDVSGQIDVTLNLRDNDETPTQVDVLIDGEVAASQVFTAEMLAEMAEEAELAGADVQSITLSLNTARYDVDEDAYTATARYDNGQRVIGAQVHVEEREAPRAASNTVEVRFNNSNTFHVLADREGIDTAMDPDGRRWYGGPDFEITVYPIPVMYDGQTVVRMTANLANDNSGSCGSETLEEAPFGFTWDCAGVEHTGMLPIVTSTVTDEGEDGPTTGFGSDLNIANVNVSADHPFPMRIDVRGPDASTGSIVIVRQSGLLNMGNWVNDQYNFMQSSAYTRPTDGGVRGVTESLVIRDMDAGGAAIAQADLEESVTNTRYRLRVIAQDALGNRTTLDQGTNSPHHPQNTFGYDVTPPDFEIAEGDDDNVYGQIEGAYNFLNQTGDEEGIYVRTTDIASGFDSTTAATHALISIRGAFQGEGAIETASIVTGSPAAISSTPFAAARADALIASHAAIDLDESAFIDQTAFEVNLPTLFADLVEARYYLYQLRLRDQAGNTTKVYRAIYLNNNSQPVVQNLSNPSVFDGATAFTASLARDSVELKYGSAEVRYPNTLGTIVWERPEAEINSVLRMNAGILDGELWNDVIYRPQNDVMFPLGWDALGLPFLKSVQTMDEASVATAKPDSVRVRVYNGFGAQMEGLNHSANPAGGSGFSAVIRNAIIDEEISDPTIEYHDTAIEVFEIVDSSATDCDNYCVRAIGPRSTFTNPFAGGPVFVAWAVDNGAQEGTGINDELQWRVFAVADANFSHPFPTRDSGADRIYEWTFDRPSDIPADASIAAIGVNANTGDGLLVADFFEAPEPEFNVNFEEASYDVEIDGAAVQMDLVHSANSTDEDFTVNSCQFVDENGNTLISDPDGLTLTVSGDGCAVDAGAGADADSWIVEANVTGDDSDITLTRQTTIVVGFPDFTIELDGPATFEIPASGTDDAVFDVNVLTGAGEPISALNCSITPTAAGVSVSVDAGGPACVVTVSSSAAPGNFTVTANATEAETGRSAQDTAPLELQAVEFTVTPDPAEIDWLDGVEIALDVGGTRSNADIDQIESSCAINSGDLTGTLTFDGDDPICTVVLDDPTAVEAGDEFEVTWTIEFGDGRIDTVVSDAFLGERPVFDPELDFSLGGDAMDNRRIIERNRTAFFEVLDGMGIGIDVAESTATVSPSDGEVDAEVVQDPDGTYLLEVIVPDDAETGNYTITVTFVENDTGDEVVVLVYINVTDTGQIIIDDGAL
jgi:hypothetical protein